jgi:hypothetical protein
VSELIKINTIEGVIFHVDDLASQRESVPYEGALWTPSPEQIMEMEEKLPPALKDFLGDHYAEYTRYAQIRQYVGVTIDGEACLWINCFCCLFDWLPCYWDLILNDNPDCCFQLIWHPSSQTFSHFTGYPQ